MKNVGLVVMAVFACIALVWALIAFDLLTFSTFAPKYENAKRDVYVNTNSYIRGNSQELRNYQAQYITAKPEDKKALKEVIKMQFSDLDETKLTPDLRVFLQEMRN